MSVLDIAALLVGALGLAFGIRCYIELWRWARQCQNARIAVARKGKVQLVAPLVEWLSWANQLAGDETSRGRVVYRNAGISVAILRPTREHTKRTQLARVINRVRHARRKSAVTT